MTIISGIRGVGKTTLARIFAKGMNCEIKDDVAEPCNECDSCLEANADTNPDIEEIDAASHNGIDDVRALQNVLQYSPTRNVRVIIWDEAHRLTPQAFDALLKTLEEPPPGNLFIMCTTNPGKIPKTIQSRAVHLQLSRLINAELRQVLKRVDKNLDPDSSKTETALNQARGSARDAINAYISNVGTNSGDDYLDFILALSSNNIEDVLGKKHDSTQILDDMLEHFHKKAIENPSDKRFSMLAKTILEWKVVACGVQQQFLSTITDLCILELSEKLCQK